MSLKPTRLLAVLLGSVFCTGAALAQQAVPDAAFQQAITEIQSSWDHIKYQMTDKDQQAKALAELETKAAAVATAYPQRAEPLVWEGIAYSTDAGVSGGLGALSKVKTAKQLFEKAIALDGRVMNGGAYTSLGSLYYMVPGWPIAFGSDSKAENNLKQALQISPDDIDANYFYADYLIHMGHYGAAMPVLQHALQAPQRPGREVADAGRRLEIQADITKAQKEQN